MDEEICEFLEGGGSVEDEVDFDYEYDAPRWFDFTRIEAPSEVVAADRWFESAKSYPPSPFIVRLNLSLEHDTSSNKSGDHNTTHSRDNDGMPFKDSGHDDKGKERMKPKSKSLIKPFLHRSSTLLKPTASHLAKQNTAGVLPTRSVGRLHQTRSPQKPSGGTNSTKRQKLEAGYLCRVAQLKHQTLFSHKSPQKVRFTDINASPSKLNVTIPKEPNLATANRAQKQRFQNSAQQGSNSKQSVCTSIARPLNRKILEGSLPSQPNKSTPLVPEVFELRTSERAAQQLSNNIATLPNTYSSAQNGIPELKRANSNASKQEKSDPIYRFKARPLNRKILLSKGDAGVFRNKKQEMSIPKEFNFSSHKPPDPPIELFNKLSISCKNPPEDQRHLTCKGSKENLPTSFTHENRFVNAVAEKSSRCWMNQGQYSGKGRATAETGSRPPSTARSFKIH